MSMTMQDYIVRFGIEGLNNISTAITSVEGLGRSVKLTAGNLEKSLPLAAKEAGVAFADLSKGTIKIIGTLKELDAQGNQTGRTLQRIQYEAMNTGNQLQKMSFNTYAGGVYAGGAKGGGTSSFAAAEGGMLASTLALAGRAALTIPIWMALRTTMEATFGVIPAGIDRFKELDLAVAQMATLTDGAFDKMDAKSKLNQLSMETGVEISKLRDVYKNLAESGLDSATSFSGMSTIVKGSIASFADAVPLARTMAGALNVLGDKFDVGATKGEKLNAMMGVMYTLWKTNGGLMDDYVGALRNAGAAANITGTGFAELMANIATMHTGLQLGSQAGNAWRMAVNDLAKPKSQEAALSFLGQDSLTPEQSADTNKFLDDIINKLDQMKKAGASGDQLNGIVNMIFGQKGGRDPATIVSLIDVARANVQKIVDLMKNPSTAGNGFLQSFSDQMNTLDAQLKRTAQIMPSLSENFLAGLSGISGSDAISNLTKLNDKLQNSEESFNKAGTSVKNFGATLVQAGIAFSVISIVSALSGIPGALTTATTAMLAFVNSPAMARFLLIAAALQTIKSVGDIGNSIKENSDTRIEAAKKVIDTQASVGTDWSTIASNMVKDGLLRNGGIGLGPNIQDPKVFDQLMDEYQKAQAARQAGLGDLGAIKISGKPSVSKSTSSSTSDFASLKEMNVDYSAMKQYGIDQLQIDKFISTELILQDETIKSHLDSVKDINEINKLDGEISSEKLKILKEQNAEAVKYADTLQKSISTNLLDSMQNKKGTPGLFASMTDTVHKQFQTNIADNASKLIMSSGIGSVSGGIFGALDDSTRAITQPILQAHIDGGNAVHDAILSAFQQATGKDMSGYMRGTSGGTSAGGVTSGSNIGGSSLPGIWGTAPFSNHNVFNSSNPGDLGNSGWSLSADDGTRYSNTSGQIQTPSYGSGMTWGQLGNMGSIAAGSSMMIAGGVNQMSGQGAKGVVGGLGSVASGIGGGVAALGAMGAFAGGGMLAGAAGMAILGPIGIALGAALMIASMFMQSDNKSTQTQTSETKVASKIDVSNQKLELINRNLLALANTMSTYALATSSYFSEKNGSLDSQFALGSARSIY